MTRAVVFPYKVYRNFPCPIIPLGLYHAGQWFQTEAYVDSGASISIFSPLEAHRIGLDFTRGRKIFSTVGDGNAIPVYLHRLATKIGKSRLQATIGFSRQLGVGFNLLGRKDFFNRFDILFSDSRRTISFLYPRQVR